MTPARAKEAIDARSFAGDIGNGSATTIPVDHNLGSFDVIVQLVDNTNSSTVFADVIRVSANQLEVSFGNPPATNEVRVLVYKIA